MPSATAACTHSDPSTTVPGVQLLFALDLNGVPSVAAPSTSLSTQGRIALTLFSSDTKMEGTLGEGGQVRASALWLAPHSFVAMTLLHGQVTGTTFVGAASNARCVTEISLDRLAPVPPQPRAKPKRRADIRTSDLVLRPDQLEVAKYP